MLKPPVAAAAEECVVAVGRELGEIAGAEVAVRRERGSGRIGTAPVAGENVRAFHFELAVDDANGNARQRKTDGAGTTLADIRIAEIHERLGHSVALENRVAEALAELFEDMRRQRRGAGDEEPHLRADRARRVGRRFEQADVHRRNAEEKRRPKIEQLIGRGAVIETLEQSHAAAADERQREEEAIAFADLPRGEQIHGVRREVVMREHRTFRSAGRS